MSRPWSPPTVVAALLVAGVALLLRTWQLAGQIVVFDEWHTLSAAVRLGYGEIFSSFAEHSSIPISLYFRWALEHTGLGVVLFRGPFLVAGLATVALPWLLWRRRVGAPVALLCAAFLAVSPVLVYHSRFARPYALALPCALLALGAASAWTERGRWQAGARYAVLVAVTGFLTLAYLPFVSTPFLRQGVAILRRPRGRLRAFASAIAIGLLALALLALLVGPAWLGDAGTITGKLQEPHDRFDWVGAARLASGSVSPLVAIAGLGLAAVGGLSLARRAPALLWAIGLPAVLQVAAVAWLQPRDLENPPVVVRYLLPSLAVTLLLVAEGCFAVGRGLVGRWWPGGRIPALRAGVAVGASSIALLVATGPQAELFRRPSGWPQELMATRLQFPAMDPARLVRADVPFYRELAGRTPGSVTVIEAPYTGFGLYSPFPWYQLRHRQVTWVAAETDACEEANRKQLPRHPGLRLPGLFFLADPDSLRQSGADYLVVHAEPAREVSYYRPDSWHVRTLRMAGAGCIDRLSQTLGPPVLRDERLAVFALDGAAGSLPVTDRGR